MAATITRERARPLKQWAPDALALNVIGDKWPMLVIRALLAGRTRRADLQRRIGISTEALTQTIKRMEADGLIARRVVHEARQRVEYELTDRGRDVVPVLAELARFGLRNCWGAPTPDQEVDVVSLFHLLPALMHELELPDGYEDSLVVLGLGPGDGPQEIVTLRFAVGEPPRIFEQPHGVVMPLFASIVAPEDTWVRVLTRRSMKGLTVRGNENAVEAVILALRGEKLDPPVAA